MVFGIKEGVIALTVIVVFYMGITLWRMRGYWGDKPDLSKSSPSPSTTSLADPLLEKPAPRLEANAFREETMSRDRENFVDQISYREYQTWVESQFLQMQDEIDAARGELAALRLELHKELTGVRATQTVSPLYGDAMQMAVAGYDADSIAERCGISRGEADLVVALSVTQRGHP